MRRTYCKNGLVLQQHMGSAFLKRGFSDVTAQNERDGPITSMSIQVAKKPRSDASSNISMANDRALPV